MALLGAMSRKNTAIGTRSTGGSGDGAHRASGMSVAIALAETMAESGHYNIDSTTVRAHVSVAGGKGGLIDELLAARGAGSPVKFIACVIRPAKPRTARRTRS